MGTVVAGDDGAHVGEVMIVLEAVVSNYCCVLVDVGGDCGRSDEWAVCDQQLGGICQRWWCAVNVVWCAAEVVLVGVQVDGLD
ncbi:Hypothetical predicted protein [Olea europaea subsp. europaea]|uniref:Uncharacterized protein n=1 Tax=Olea europaea subsp. europaea TaxID=158383 RepID=A0A8S0SUC3_OLEEU|nr:Hypothetical predicted protein [Olea europaea subsp. europaea]